MINLKDLTIEKTHEHLKNGDFTVLELVEAYRTVIAEKNKEMNAYVEIFDDALVYANEAQERFKNGTATLLTGIPFAFKDNMLIDGKQVSCGSKILEEYTATYDGTVAQILKKEGAIILGRTNMDEFAMGSSTESSIYGVTKNPYDMTRVAGGSSGGSAAAVALDMALVSLGSDTGGSIRQPAAFCGTVGFKPTYGTISRYGLVAMANSLDQIGPFTKTVRDAEIIFKTLARPDPMDSTSIPDALRKSPKSSSKKIGVPYSFLKGEGIEPEILANFNQNIEKLKSAGYEIIDVSLPLMSYSLAVYYILMPAESSTNLSRFDGIRYGFQAKGVTDLRHVYGATRGQGFGPEVRRRILLGTYVLSHGYYDAYYNKAIALREQITQEFKKIFETVDIIAMPTTPTAAFKIGEKTTDPVAMYLSDILTVPANIAGLPAISIPSGTNTIGLPLSMQFMATHFAEDILFAIGKDFEKQIQI